MACLFAMTTGDDRSELLDQLRVRLNQLYREGGEPSTREVSQRTRRAMSHTTVNQVLRCAKTPRWNYLELVVEALGGSIEEFRALWVAVRNGESPVPELVSGQRDMFVNMARRSQTMVDQFIDYLAYMQRGQLDLNQREDVLALERIAIRMRRHNENLLLLAGVELGRIPKDPVPLIDVIRAAQAELGETRRVDMSLQDRAMGIAPPAVRPVVRLVAELLDNALAFSPPQGPPVMVTTELVSSGAVLRIDDSGIGIPTATIADFTEWLANTDSGGTASSRMMGLVVVARLAARHAIGIELRRKASRGSVAVVTIPTSLLVRMGSPQPTQYARFPDQSYRVMFDSMPKKDLAKLVDLLPREQARLVLAGLAADRAQAVLDRTRSPDWPATKEPPVRRNRPGLQNN
jgi:signal transduction histidine kinase